MNLLNNRKPPYSLIYSLRLIELEMLKVCIEANLAGGFIRSFKSFINVQILFIYKKNDSFYLYINYRKLNNLTIKNYYLLFLINRSYDCLNYAKYFT